MLSQLDLLLSYCCSTAPAAAGNAVAIAVARRYVRPFSLWSLLACRTYGRYQMSKPLRAANRNSEPSGYASVMNHLKQFVWPRTATRSAALQ